MSDRNVIVNGARTPMGRLLGALKNQSAMDLGGMAIKAALERSGMSPDQVQYVIMGQVLQAGAGQIPSRQAAVQAGLRAISGTSAGSYANEAERLTGKVLERLRYDRITEIFHLGLHSYLSEMLQMCGAIGEDIARNYFYYTVVA
jgi:hypothetical protein